MSNSDGETVMKKQLMGTLKPQYITYPITSPSLKHHHKINDALGFYIAERLALLSEIARSIDVSKRCCGLW